MKRFWRGHEEDDAEEDEAAKLLPCPTCKVENSITNLPHKCSSQGCGFVFKLGRGGFVLDGFVDDNSDDEDVELSSEEEEEEFESEEDTDTEESESSEDDSDGEWLPKSKKLRTD